MIRMFESSTAWPEEEGRALTDFRPPEPPDITVDFDSRHASSSRTAATSSPTCSAWATAAAGPRAAAGRRSSATRDGKPVHTGVTTAEVMAVLRDVGREQDAVRDDARHGRVLRAGSRRVLAGAADRGAAAPGGPRRPQPAARVAQAAAGARSSSGSSPARRCATCASAAASSAGGGKLDTSWFQRRAGLLPDRCSKTGKLRFARTANYAVFCRLVRAAGAEPHELGV